jgi:3-oxoacyl-[acyl-carrier-protein] synthase-3
MGAIATGWGAAVPEHELDNYKLASHLGISPDWIFERTGIGSRHIASADETSSSLAIAAGIRALERAGVPTESLDVVIVATVTPDYQFPATASLVQAGLHAHRASAFDVGAGCSGFLMALAQAGALIETGAASRVLVCGADVLSRITNYSDPKTCVLFGDGAGAAVLEADHRVGVGPFTFQSDGSKPELLFVDPGDGLIHMEGREVYRRAVETMAGSVTDLLDRCHLRVEDIDLLIAHQANARILDAVVARVGIAPEKVVSNIDRYGNTSAASIPIAMSEAVEEGRVADGDLVMLTAFGAGFVWGAGMLRHATVPQRSRDVAILEGTRA